MKIPQIFNFVVVATILLVGRSFGQQLACVRPGATGANNGTNWTDAFSQIPENPVRGTTYYLAGGNYGVFAGITANAGTATITLKKATDSVHGTNIGWQPQYETGQAVFSGITLSSDYWVIDGAYRTDLRSGHGIAIKNSTLDNVTLVYLSYSYSLLRSPTNISLLFVEMAGDAAFLKRTTGIYGADQGAGNCSNLTIQYCNIHDLFGVPLFLIAGNNITLQNSIVARNHSTADWHTEGIQARETTGLNVINCTFEDIDGTAIIRSGSGASSLWDIESNVFLMNGNGVPAHVLSNDGSIANVTFSRNIIVGQNNNGSAGFSLVNTSGTLTCQHNIWYQCSWVPFSAFAVPNRDYNWFSQVKTPYASAPFGAHETAFHDVGSGLYSNEVSCPFTFTPTPSVSTAIQF